MNKSISMFVGGVLIGALLASAGFSLFLRGQKGGGQSRMVLKLGHGLDTAHPVHKAMEFMKLRLEELSGGSVTIDIYPSSVLGSETQCIEQLQNGSLAMTKTSAAAMENFIPAMAVYGLPYVFRDADHYWSVLNGEVGQGLLKKGESKFLRGLCYYDGGSRNFYTKDAPIRTPDDLKGLKIRVKQSAQLYLQQALRGLQTFHARWPYPHSRHAADKFQGLEKARSAGAGLGAAGCQRIL